LCVPSIAATIEPGQVALLENVRFEPGEEKNDDDLATKLASLADVYVNDAFGAAHRAHASTAGVAGKLPNAAGLLMARELFALSKALDDPARPLVVLLGGAKISDKIGVIRKFLGSADAIVIGGAMANTFLAAKGVAMKKSKIEDDKLALARTLLEKAEAKRATVLLPVDVVVAASLDAAEGQVVPVGSVPDGMMALDIGPATVELFSKEFAKAKTIFWNGPMGLFEKAPFSKGTFGVAKAIAEAAAVVVVGGGDSVAAVQQADLAARFTHVSTGGGASLELIEGRKLPGVEALRA